jgi:hypothetical protein
VAKGDLDSPFIARLLSGTLYGIAPGSEGSITYHVDMQVNILLIQHYHTGCKVILAYAKAAVVGSRGIIAEGFEDRTRADLIRAVEKEFHRIHSNVLAAVLCLPITHH